MVETALGSCMVRVDMMSSWAFGWWVFGFWVSRLRAQGCTGFLWWLSVESFQSHSEGRFRSQLWNSFFSGLGFRS